MWQLFFLSSPFAKSTQTHHLLPPLIHTNTNTPTQTHKTCKSTTIKTQIPPSTQHHPIFTTQPPPLSPVKTTNHHKTPLKQRKPKIQQKPNLIYQKSTENQLKIKPSTEKPITQTQNQNQDTNPMVAARLKSDERDSTMQASTKRDFFRSLRSVLVVEIGSCGGELI